jgi:hypothetical protein
MNNLFCTGLKIDKRYDLKGSTLGRITIHEKDKPIDTTIALKDLNFINENSLYLRCLDFLISSLIWGLEFVKALSQDCPHVLNWIKF